MNIGFKPGHFAWLITNRLPRSGLVRALGLILLVLATMGASCTSRLDVNALTVLDSADGAGGHKEPVALAAVFFECPAIIHPGRVRLGFTDEQGHFYYEEWGGINIHDGCDIYVEKEGYEPLKFAVRDVCTHFIEDLARHCEMVKIRADMRKKKVQ